MFLPTPSGVATAAVELFANGTIIEATLISLATFATGYLLAVALAIPMGLMMGGFKKVGEALDVYINAFNAMPRIALIPLIMIWFGLDFQAKVVIVLISAFFPIVISLSTNFLASLALAFVVLILSFNKAAFAISRIVAFLRLEFLLNLFPEIPCRI